MLKKGKKVNYVDSNNYVKNIDNNNFLYRSYASQIPDSVRFFSKNFWIISNNELREPDKNNSFFSLKKITEDTYEIIADKTKFFDNFLDNGLIVERFNQDFWETFIQDIIPSSEEIFFDHYIDFFEPIKIRKVEKNIEKGAAFINYEFTYNFYVPKFESLVNDIFFNINSVPSIFNVLNDNKVDIRTEEENLNLSLGGFIPSNNVDSLFLSKNTNDNLKEYFNNFVDAYENPDTNLAKQQILDNQKDLLIDKTKLELLSKTSFIPFPFYFETQFTNLAIHNTDLIHKLIENENLHLDLIETIREVSSFNSFETINVVYSGNEERKAKIFDLKNWIQDTLTLTGVDLQIQPDKANKYLKLIKELKDNIKPKTRNYEQLLNQPAHSEILFYKIEKRQFPNSPTPLQSFWVIPTKEELIKFIDTQIKYGNNFFYRTYAYVLVAGNQYEYTDYSYNPIERQEDLANGRYKIKIKNTTTYKILEIPYWESSGAIYESPYTKPNMKFASEQGNVRFLIEQSSTDTFEEHEGIEIGETELFENIRISQDNELQETIKAILPAQQAKEMQIYRINSRPRNYLSFQGKLYKKILLNVNQNSFIDTLIPNIKYYYTFRYLNEHKIPSNPSLVYEIELIEQDGFFDLRVETINLKQPPKKVKQKTMKKYLLIRPSLIQTRAKYQAEASSISEIDLGADQSSVWNKKFKLRIKSKNTNRVLEINISPTFVRKKT